MTPEDLSKYVLVMREHNVTAFKTADVEINLGPAPASVHAPDASPARKKNDYERLLFAATEGMPDEDGDE